MHSSTSQTALYLQAPLAAVLSWDNATRQRLLFEGFILNGQAEGNFTTFFFFFWCRGRDTPAVSVIVFSQKSTVTKLHKGSVQ